MIAGYITFSALNVGASYLEVFRFVGTSAFMAIHLCCCKIPFGINVPGSIP